MRRRYWRSATFMSRTSAPGRMRRADWSGASTTSMRRPACPTPSTSSASAPDGNIVIRDAKAIVPSAWLRAAGIDASRSRVAEIADGRFRSADPHYKLDGSILVRRLSPNSRKLDLESVEYRWKLVDDRM